MDATVHHAGLALDDPSRGLTRGIPRCGSSGRPCTWPGARCSSGWPPSCGRWSRACDAVGAGVDRAGELIDKITILEIKSERISDREKLEHVRAELAVLTEARDRSIFDGGGLSALVAELKSINESLWRIEDDIRACERAGDFGPRFIELARSSTRPTTGGRRSNGGSTSGSARRSSRRNRTAPRMRIDGR